MNTFQGTYFPKNDPTTKECRVNLLNMMSFTYPRLSSILSFLLYAKKLPPEYKHVRSRPYLLNREIPAQ